MAEELGVTDRQLRRFFWAKFGQSPHAWVTSNRLEEARQELTQGSLVKQAAMSVGFTKQGNLTRQFKRYFQVTPSSLRSSPECPNVIREKS